MGSRQIQISPALFFGDVDYYPRTDQRQVGVFAAMQDTAHGEAASCEPRLPAAGRKTILDRLFNKSSAPENGAFQLPLEPEEELNRPEARENELGDCHADPFPDSQMNMDETDIAPSRLEDPSYFTQGFLRVQEMFHHPDTGDQVKVLRRKGKAFSQGKAEIRLGPGSRLADRFDGEVNCKFLPILPGSQQKALPAPDFQ